MNKIIRIIMEVLLFPVLILAVFLQVLGTLFEFLGFFLSKLMSYWFSKFNDP